MKVIESEYRLGEVTPNIAQMLRNNAELFGTKTAFQHKINGKFEGINWKQFYNNIVNIAANLRKFGFSEGDKVVIYSKNRYEMLALELAIMSSGGVSVMNWIPRDHAVWDEHSGVFLWPHESAAHSLPGVHPPSPSSITPLSSQRRSWSG